MFDSMIYNEKEYVPYERSVKITENRAPTDESIRLAEEYREKAVRNILGTWRLTNNTLDCTVHKVKDFDGDKWYVRSMINGKEYMEIGNLPRFSDAEKVLKDTIVSLILRAIVGNFKFDFLGK